MKVKVLVRNPSEYYRETKRDIHKVQRNYDPALHPFEAPREYVQALNAVKLERVFAKPFIGALDGHRDGIQCLRSHPKRLNTVLSGCCDGEIKIWDISIRRCASTIQAHTGFVRGIDFSADGRSYFSVGDDKTIKQWRLDVAEEDDIQESMNTVVAKTMLTGITHHQTDPIFATCGEGAHVYDESRATPICSYSWGADSICSVKFNPVETNILGSCGSDRSIILYDIREATPVRKVMLKLRSNTLSWNPMEAFIFTAANEDYNLYTFDIRQLKRPVNVHIDHVEAVIDVNYCPTGKEFVSGSFDKTIRIFPSGRANSREVYSAKRMQHISCITYTADSKYILSASDEMIIRIWKTKASEKLGLLHSREKSALNYGEKLKEKYAHHPEIRRISKKRHVPKHVLTHTKEIRSIKDSQKRKEDNRRKHSKPGVVPFVPERDKHVINEQE